MSSLKENEDQQSSPNTVFTTLVQYLEQSFRQHGVVKIPIEIVLPFRKTSLTDANFPLRDLHKVLENGRPKNILRLAPVSLCTIASIVLQVPYSLVQLKLIHLLMDLLRQHRNEAAFSAVLTRARATSVTPDDVKTQKDLICKNMATCVLRLLTSTDKNQLLRYTMAQLLAVVLYTSPTARESNASAPEWRALASLIETDENCLLRVLTANVVRQMSCTKMESALFKKSLGSLRDIDAFPVSEQADSDWLNRIMEYVNISKERYSLSRERERLYRVKRFECQQDGPQAAADRPVLIAGVSSDITLIMPENPDAPTMFSIPIMDCLSVNRIFSESEPYAIELKFPDNVGYRIKNGTKNAMDNITIVLQDDEAADFLLREIQDRQVFADTSIHEAESTSRKNENRVSISATFVDLHVDTSEASADEHDKLETLCTEAQSSEFEISSPLETLSQRSLQQKARPASRPERKGIDASAETGAENIGSKAARRQVAGSNSVHQPSEHDSQSRMLEPDTKGAIRQSGKPSRRKKGSSSNKEVTSQRAPSSKLPEHGQAPSDQSPLNLDTTEANEQANVKKTRSMPSVAPIPSDKPLVVTQKLKSKTRNLHNKVPHKFTQTPAIMGFQDGNISQVSPPAAPTKPALKKRSLKQSITGCKLSQAPVLSEALPNEFDLPSVDQESEHSKKRVKIKSSKQPTSFSEAAGTAGKRTGTPKVSNSRNLAEGVKGRKKVGKSTNKKEPKTAASKRTRRAIKSQAYVESSDSQSEDAQADHGDARTEKKNERKEDSAEYAEDSYPISKEQAEVALQDSVLNLDSKLQKMVSSSGRKDPISLTRQIVGANEPGPGQKATPVRIIQPISESSIPPVSESKVRRTSIIKFGPDGPRNQTTPITPAARVTTQPTQGLLEQGQVTPIECQKRVSTEKGNRDENPKGEGSRRRTSPAPANRTTDLGNTTSDNEQRLASPAAMDMCVDLVTHSPERSTVMDDDKGAHISPEKDTGKFCFVDADVLDVQDVQDHVIADNTVAESGHNANKTRNDALGISRHIEERCIRKVVTRGLRQDRVEADRGITTYEASSECSSVATSPQNLSKIKPTNSKNDRKQTKMTTHPGQSSHAATPKMSTILNTSAVDNEIDEEAHDLESYAEEDISPLVSSNDDTSRHDPAEYIASDSSDGVMELSTTMHDAGCQTLQSSLEAASHPPTPLPEDSIYAKVHTKPQDPVFSPLHDRRRIGVASIVDKNNSLNGKTMNMDDRSSNLRPGGEAESIRDDTVLPTQEALDRTEASVQPNYWNGRAVPSTSNVGRGARTSLGDPMRRVNGSRKALPSMAPPPPPTRTKPEVEVMPHRAPASDPAVAPAPPQAPFSKSGQLHPLRASMSTDVLCRLGQEEDAVKSKTHEFFRGGDTVIQTLTDSWNERLGHEHRNLLTKLEEEKDVLRKASKLMKEQDVNSWKETICNPIRKEERGKGNDSLTARIEALRNGH
ncbi:hypothetical protein H2204_012174 [Knufia peltigerae]|uniref:Uncharacterized protein n=1 Tax=Knufia peltigerae TaxID=1002370 RepID=A0AA38XTR8_9EURO|nr:hypothetical protein H2204_012174 [Knufia peltigerae]